MPTDARGTSRAAAKAFVRHYVDLINHAVATGESQPLLAASTKSCDSCAAVAERVDDVYAQGGYIKSRGWRLQSLRPVPLQAADRPMFDLGLTLSPQEVVESAGAEPKRYEGGKLPVTITLARRGDVWKVVNWERVA